MIRLISCGHHYVHSGGITIDRPAGAGNYAFVLFKSDAEIMLNGRRMAVEKNSFILFHPATPHLYKETEKPFVNDWFHCEGGQIHNFLERIQFPLDTPVEAADPLLIARYIKELHRIKRTGGPLHEEMIDADLRSLFLKLQHGLHPPPLPEKTSRYYRQFTALRNDMYNSPQKHRSIETLAAQVNMSKSYFQHIYKEMFGTSVVNDMIRIRLDYAKYLLDNTSLPIAAVARMCGYEHDTHFMRQFKKFAGVTPGQYKSGLKKQVRDL